jgi:predicted O-linked N-acetylglucosamine transferase (SPINDLY family)
MADRQLIDDLLRQIESQIRLGHWLAVEALCRQVLELNPHDAASWHHLSIAHFEQGRRPDAEASSRRAIAENASQSAFWLHLGNILFQSERFDEAAAAYRQSLSLDPSDPTAWNNLGSAEHLQKHWAAAQQAYESSLALAPAQLDARLKLADVHERCLSFPAAEQIARQLVAEYAGCADAWSLLGRVQLALAKQHDAIASLRRAVEIELSPQRHSRMLQAMQYAKDVSPSTLLAEHRNWDQIHAAPMLPLPSAMSAGPSLRIGFISSDLGLNPVAHMVLPLLKAVDKRHCQITCYFDNSVEDDFTLQFREAADHWRPTYGLSDEALANQIRADKIDVLVDLMGHAGNRLLVFARKPALTQITWFGYVGTTGMTAMDYLLADRFHVPPGEENQYVETVLRMPHGYACYGPPVDAPPVAELPAFSADHVTFGCFNNPAKWTRRMLDVWSQVLQRVPTARLLLKYYGLHDPQSQDRFRSQFAAHGIDPNRILFEGWSPHAELLAAYNRVDLALDTQPYSGGVTTCEALWMGVPTITYPGATFAGRHSTSHLANAGYGQFVACDAADYVELAAGWANRLDELAAIRSTTREQARRSPLCDAKQFAADFLTVVRRAWQSKQAAAWSSHGLKKAQLGQFDEAEAALKQSLSLSPGQVALQYNLALALSFQGKLDEAESLLNQIFRTQPNFAAAWSLLGVILNKQLRRDEALAALKRSIDLEPNPHSHGLLLLEQQYQADVSPAGLHAAHKQWNARHAAPLLPSAPGGIANRSTGQPLRLGFVSADFRRHPVGFLSYGAIKHLDRTRCSVVCYSDRLAEDPLTVLFRQTADQWRMIAEQSDHEVAEQVKADEIDILIDLAGHAGKRLLVFARKPAPIQVTWLGYVGTTGLAAMDFLLADRFHVPAGEEPHYVESVLRMPHGYACYSPPDDAPSVEPLPSLAGSPFTFGCFNNPSKYSLRMLDAWAEILRRVPAARLLLKHTCLDQAQLQQRIHNHLARRDLDPSRILFEGPSPLREFLAAYRRVDLALDTQPYSGGLTTCEALWMGVPVVTHPGATFAGRHSTSHLSNAGYEQFIARDLADYIDLAASWANRIDELATIRSTMRQQVRTSHLCNAAEFANDFLAVLSKARTQITK